MSDKLIRTIGETDGKCSECGCDFQKNPPEFCFHGDGEKEYVYGFRCVKCGNSIMQYFERGDSWFGDWVDEDEND